ncbi:hypothetical protein IE53DRAFT_381263 [Violaceomyces palustris]|uniref:Uncharacterized protein n=1 Tax=Violaceomyces palustris TaxID=1673888 RepID=A0ACD0NRR3_9BASI|nr:hypothetical protein IE53DRAFT_381263 [Violaceomyces palustris]
MVTKANHIRQVAQQHASASAGSGEKGQPPRPQSSQPTITSAVAAEPRLAPSKAAKQLYPLPSAFKRGLIRFRIKEQLEEGRGKHWVWHKGAVHKRNLEPDDDELQRVREKYGYPQEDKGGPSRLYLMMLADALLPLPRNQMSGVVSPPLLATTGIVPLSIFSTGPDIIGHYYDCIVAARKEVILLTNYWQGGKNVDKIAEALVELNARVETRRRQAASKARKAGEPLKPNGSALAPEEGKDDEKVREEQASKDRERLDAEGAPGAINGSDGAVPPNADEVEVGAPEPEEQIVVKIMWDRGPQTLADLFRLRKPVPPRMWKKNGLPEEHEIPNLKMEILNYHRPLMGTFHAKLLLVDREVALINSNNIQDRPNVEACCRLEGDIVNSIYDHALCSWGNTLEPALPCLSTPAPVKPSASAFTTGSESTLPKITVERLREISIQARQRLYEEDEATEEEKERSLASPLGRLHLAEMVDSVMDSVIRKDGVRSTGAAAGGAGGDQAPSSPNESSDGERAARRAGALWAQKALGERFSHFQMGRQNSAASGGAGSPLESSPTTEGDNHGHGPHSRRHFADIVEAMMKKEGIKPGGWAEGALEVFGLGPSSSRNVANEVRRNPRSKAALDAQARRLRIPKAVDEEDGRVDEDEATEQCQEEVKGGDADSHWTDGDRTAGDDVSNDDGHTASPSQGTEARKVSSSQTLNGDAFPVEDGGISSATFPTSPSPKMLDTSCLSPPNDNVHRVHDEDSGGAPGSIAYRNYHRRTVSDMSRTSTAERLGKITASLDFANNSKVQGEIKAEDVEQVVKEASEDVLDFQPYVFHAPHDPVPMALVNRRPHGTPGHSDIRNPQDAAWLAGFRYAKEHAFIQSPTLNASPIKAAVLACVRRHVRVELWLDLGFNDKSESMPFQGGTNEQVVTAMYRQLRREGKGDEKYLEVYWYTGKDMTRPLNAVRKQRNCHVKFASFDGQVAILGSGNQDTQSWFHSQEINVMVDSAQIVSEWMKALRRNQSTHIYGKVDQRDGIWRGRNGAEVADTGKDGGDKAANQNGSSRSNSNSPVGSAIFSRRNEGQRSRDGSISGGRGDGDGGLDK